MPKPRKHREPGWRMQRWAIAAMIAIPILIAAVLWLWQEQNHTTDHVNSLQKQVAANNGQAKTLYSQAASAGVTPTVTPSGAAPATITGPAGVNGLNGRGIVSSALIGGHLVLTYTDGSTADVGLVVGPAGAAGSSGAQGSAGASGATVTGPAGPSGADGANGADGRGIASTSITADGHLVVTYTDGTSADLGVVVGSQGATGADGPPIQSFTFTVPGALGGSTTYVCTYPDYQCEQQ